MLTNTIVPAEKLKRRPGRVGPLTRFARRLVHAALARVRVGAVEVREGAERGVFGQSDAPSELRAVLTVRDPRFYRAVVWGGTLGAGEAYIDGDWSADDLTSLIRVLVRNESAFSNLNGILTRLADAAQRVGHALRRNTRRGSRRNIAAHYDLSNELYALFLDETMTYSCGIFERPDSTLREASTAKLDRICRKLKLSPADHVLEIGAGWGSFAIHAASQYGCRVTTTTISAQQHALARRRIAEAGLDDRVELLRCDYRDLKGQYDKLVSIEMVEAVGWQFYDAYFAKCASLLKAEGVACIQAITMADRYYESAKRSVDFIKRCIFPGSCIPSIGAMAASVARASDLTMMDLEDITPHYATTLREWRQRFRAQLPRVRELGFPEEFIRMWEFYLCYCEAGFHERTIGDVQLMLCKPGFRDPAPPPVRPLCDAP